MTTVREEWKQAFQDMGWHDIRRAIDKNQTIEVYKVWKLTFPDMGYEDIRCAIDKHQTIEDYIEAYEKMKKDFLDLSYPEIFDKIEGSETKND